MLTFCGAFASRDTSLNTVALPDSLDIDRDARWNGNIDIGADEATQSRQIH